MDESINTKEKRIKSLLAFSMGMISGEDGKTLMEKHKQAIENITPFDMLALEDKQLEMGITTHEIKRTIGKVLNIFGKYLQQYKWDKPKQGSFLYYLMQENRALENHLRQTTNFIKKINSINPETPEYIEALNNLKSNIVKLKEFNTHYIKKENILFPYLEKLWKDYKPLMVMWSLHNDIRKKIKFIEKLLNYENSNLKEINRALGELFFLLHGMIFKEEVIAFPIASETIKEEDWEEMHKQSFEIGFPFIDAPTKVKKENILNHLLSSKFLENSVIDLGTGKLNIEQIILLLNTLPVDITLIDENDNVKFFSKPKDEIFARTVAIIGRKVQNCHTPESVHIVEGIIKSFKSGEKKFEHFWIQMKGKFICIQYYALINENGVYKGVLEVSQDITDIKNLSGEKRLVNL
ncbi:MAG: DUF438 domain-containing protein [Bacteroidetes bacterium]|nr:DUF438 domain-containing protein [Bacteroidota bacterium]